MSDLSGAGRLLLVLGGICIGVGLLFLLIGRTSLPLGRLPGDIRFQQGNFSCFAPLTTMILVSIVLTLVLNIVLRILNR